MPTIKSSQSLTSKSSFPIKDSAKLNSYQYRTALHPEHFLVPKFPHTRQESPVPETPGMMLESLRPPPGTETSPAPAPPPSPPPPPPPPPPPSKLASTTKYFDAVFFTKWSSPKATTKDVNMNCRNQLRSKENPDTCIYAASTLIVESWVVGFFIDENALALSRYLPLELGFWINGDSQRKSETPDIWLSHFLSPSSPLFASFPRKSQFLALL